MLSGVIALASMPPMLDAKTDDRRAVAVIDVFCLHVLPCTLAGSSGPHLCLLCLLRVSVRPAPAAYSASWSK